MSTETPPSDTSDTITTTTTTTTTTVSTPVLTYTKLDNTKLNKYILMTGSFGDMIALLFGFIIALGAMVISIVPNFATSYKVLQTLEKPESRSIFVKFVTDFKDHVTANPDLVWSAMLIGFGWWLLINYEQGVRNINTNVTVVANTALDWDNGGVMTYLFLFGFAIGIIARGRAWLTSTSPIIPLYLSVIMMFIHASRADESTSGIVYAAFAILASLFLMVHTYVMSMTPTDVRNWCMWAFVFVCLTGSQVSMLDQSTGSTVGWALAFGTLMIMLAVGYVWLLMNPPKISAPSVSSPIVSHSAPVEGAPKPEVVARAVRSAP